MRVAVIRIIVLAIMFEQQALAYQEEEAKAPDLGGAQPIVLRIWTPEILAAPSTGDNTKTRQRRPLVVISHGAGGGNTDHRDTAQALADAGYVVAAVMHTGGNYKDMSHARTDLDDRPGHIVRAIDYLLSNWYGHWQIDPNRIGMMGFSAGGFTALVIAGGVPDLSRTTAHCREKPQAWDCNYLKKHGVSTDSPRIARRWVHDARVKAAVVAAPAVGYSFVPNGLAAIHIPIQIWAAERDVVVEDSGAIVDRLLAAPHEYHLIKGAGHFSFMAPCSWSFHALITTMSWFGTEKICSDPSGFDREVFHQQFNAGVVRFFGERLQ